MYCVNPPALRADFTITITGSIAVLVISAAIDAAIVVAVDFNNTAPVVVVNFTTTATLPNTDMVYFSTHHVNFSIRVVPRSPYNKIRERINSKASVSGTPPGTFTTSFPQSAADLSNSVEAHFWNHDAITMRGLRLKCRPSLWYRCHCNRSSGGDTRCGRWCRGLVSAGWWGLEFACSVQSKAEPGLFTRHPDSANAFYEIFPWRRVCTVWHPYSCR